MRTYRNKFGFTLIEVMISVAIVAVVSTSVIGAFATVYSAYRDTYSQVFLPLHGRNVREKILHSDTGLASILSTTTPVITTDGDLEYSIASIDHSVDLLKNSDQTWVLNSVTTDTHTLSLSGLADAGSGDVTVDTTRANREKYQLQEADAVIIDDTNLYYRDISFDILLRHQQGDHVYTYLQPIKMRIEQ